MNTPEIRKRKARPNENTETAFLDAAERMFGELGYDAASVRAIAEQAGANLGALHYYWGSKEALLRAACERRLRPVSEERLRRMDACLVEAGGQTPSLRSVLRAFIEPALHHDGETTEQREMIGRLLSCLAGSAAPEVQRIRSAITDEASMRFVRLLRMALPDLDDETFYWRLHAVLGTLQYVTKGTGRIENLSNGRFRGDNRRRAADEFVEGLFALLSAPPLQHTESPQ